MLEAVLQSPQPHRWMEIAVGGYSATVEILDSKMPTPDTEPNRELSTSRATSRIRERSLEFGFIHGHCLVDSTPLYGANAVLKIESSISDLDDGFQSWCSSLAEFTATGSIPWVPPQPVVTRVCLVGESYSRGFVSSLDEKRNDSLLAPPS